MKKELRRLNWIKKLHVLLVPFLFGAVGHSPGQSPDFWEIHMHEDDWIPSENGWQLNASESGESWICFCPVDSISDSAGRTIMLHWSQQLAGSTQNFSRVHLIPRSNLEWSAANVPPFSVSSWESDSAISALEPGNFLHLGESGSVDSLRWMLTRVGESHEQIAAAPSPILAGQIEHWMLWSQHPASDSTFIQWSASSEPLEWTHAMEGNAGIVTDCIGFSAKFTTSHVDDFRIEVASLTPYVTDTIPPVCIDYRWLGNHALELQFNEPLSSSTGFGIWNDGDSLFFNAESHMSNKRIGIFSGNWPIGQARELSLHGIQDVQGIEGTQTPIEVLRTSSQGIKPHAVQFTEIMFDPSPSLGLPEEEWIEIINRSELHHSIEDFILLDGSSETQSNLTPQFGWDGILAPGERAIVTGSDVCIAGDSMRQAEGIPWPGLNNAGESLMLLGEDGSIADQVHYSSDWMAGLTDGGVSLQIIHWDACNGPSNWGPSVHPMGSTPGTSSPEENAPTTEILPLELVAITPTGEARGLLTFNQPLDPHAPFNLRGINGGHLSLMPEDHKTLAWHIDSQLSNGKLEFDVTGIMPCAPSAVDVSAWTIQLEPHRFPAFQDLLITEIAHDPRGMTDAWGSFVEVTNVHETDTLELGGIQCNGSSPLHRITLAPGARHCFYEIDLPNGTGLVAIRATDGTLIDEVGYSNCWHRERKNEGSGKSLVRLNLLPGLHGAFNWNSSMDSRGCSPGISDLAEESVTSIAAPILCGISENQWVVLFNGPVEIETAQWTAVDPGDHGGWGAGLDAKQLWMGPSQFEALEDSIAQLHWSEEAISIASICPTSPFVVDDVECDFSLNEVQQLKLDGPEPFIEIKHHSQPWLSTDGLQLTTTTSPNPIDWLPLSSEIRWFIPMDTPVAFSRCPSRWMQQQGRIIPSNLPSLWGNREVQLARSGALIDSIHLHPDLESPWNDWHHIRSLERVAPPFSVETECLSPSRQWESSLDELGATPGKWNSWQKQRFAADRALKSLVVLNDTWRLASNGAIEPIQVLVRAPGAGAWKVHLTIANANGIRISMLTDDAIWVSQEEDQTVLWDGFVGTRIPPPGSYWITAHFQHHESQEVHKYLRPIHIMPWR
jgi:hypothetical protein